MPRIHLIVLLSLLSVSCSHGDVDFKKPLDLKYTAVDGRKVDLSQLRGKVVLVDFWATWCPPCRVVSPDLVELYKKYHDQGFEIVGISVDSDKKQLTDFVRKEGEPWPQYFDDAGDSKLVATYGVESYPTIWLVDKQGKVVNQNMIEQWMDGTTSAGIPFKTTDATKKRLGALIEKYLKAP